MTVTSATTVIASPERLGKAGKRRKRSVLVGFSFIIVGLVVVCALFGQLIAPYDAGTQNLSDTLATPTSKR